MNQNNEPPKVVFEEENVGWKAMKYYREPTTPKIVDWVMKYSGGYVKDERYATYVIFGFVILVVIIVFLLIFNQEGTAYKPPDKVLREMPVR